MAKDTSIGRDAHSSETLAPQVAPGYGRSTSETFCVRLRHAGYKGPQLAALRVALVAGESSGDAEPFKLEAFVADKRL